MTFTRTSVRNEPFESQSTDGRYLVRQVLRDGETLYRLIDLGQTSEERELDPRPTLFRTVKAAYRSVYLRQQEDGLVAI